MLLMSLLGLIVIPILFPLGKWVESGLSFVPAHVYEGKSHLECLSNKYNVAFDFSGGDDDDDEDDDDDDDDDDDE